MSKIPTLIDCPKGSEKWTVFGMIDLDYDDPTGEYMSSPRLFVTDTHDLETLLLSTDDGLLQRIDECVIPEEDSKKAFYLAYQLGLIRQVIYEVNDSPLSLNPLSGGGQEDMDYASFVDGYEVNLKKLLNYLNEKNAEPIPAPKLKKLLEKIASNKRIKKRITNEYIWNSTWEAFDPAKVTDFWEVVNGHDILSLLRYINQDAAEKYDNKNAFSLNRDFELDLVDNYDYANLERTKTYKDMRGEEVVVAV